MARKITDRKPLGPCPPNVAMVTLPVEVSTRFTINGEVFDWPELAAIPNIGDILREVRRIGAAYSHVRGPLNQLRRFLAFLAERNMSVCEPSLKAWRDYLSNNTNIEANTKSELFSYAIRTVKALQAAGICEHFILPKQFEREEAKPKESLYDLAPTKWETSLTPVRDLATKFIDERGWSTEPALALATSILRIDAVRAHATKEIEIIYRDFIHAKNVIETLKTDQRLKSVFRSSNISPSTCDISTLIAWIYNEYGPILPDTRVMNSGIYQRLKTEFGGLRAFQARFCPTADSLAPFMALFLAEKACAPNPNGVFKYTYRGCVGPGVSPASAVVTFGKVRGEGEEKEISREVARGKSGEWTLPRALEFLHDYTRVLIDSGYPLDRSAQIDKRIRLFIHFDKTNKKTVSGLDPSTFIDVIRRFMARAADEHDVLVAVANATPVAFRPTHALISKLEGQNIFRTQLQLGHQSPNTTRSYTERLATTTVGNARIAAFQDFLASAIAARATVSEADSAEAASATPVGNGYFCRAPQAGAQPGVEAGETCWRFDKCDDCTESILIIEDVEVTADWMRWERHIIDQQAFLEHNYPDRWRRWSHRLAMYQAFIAATSAGVRAKARHQVEAGSAKPLPSLT